MLLHSCVGYPIVTTFSSTRFNFLGGLGGLDGLVFDEIPLCSYFQFSV